jgi:hypothetical protein
MTVLAKVSINLTDRPIVLRRQSEEYEADVRWPPACEDASTGAEDRALLEDVTKQRNKDSD